ncbi:hypothetical protein [Rhodovulum steppense]|uniref:Uncharacterized protein n=1 Tax=Rhodovulum steppense TaxID=540251 RepID=A0A4R1YVJ9_9RHOB|nr:hypothetical protein [Rhodovulum steppense]TCM84773.1 hypothetical protein EV216_11091 [Rhodovulum steppense]
MGTRDIFSGSSAGPIPGPSFLDQYAMHMAALYRASCFPLTGVAGVNTITATLEPPLGASGLIDGMRFGISWASVNTGGMTLSIGGLPPVPVLDAEGATLLPGSVSAGLRSTLEYVGGAFRVQSPLLAGASADAGSFYWQFEVSGTWTKPGGLHDNRLVRVHAIGAGGGSSGYTPGGGGACAIGIFRAAELPGTVSILIAAGGVGRTDNNPAGSAGDTTFGSLLTGYGAGAMASGSSQPATPGGMFARGLGGGWNAYHCGGYSDPADEGRKHSWWGGAGGARGTDGGGLSAFAGRGGNLNEGGVAPGGGAGRRTSGGPYNGARGEVRIWI